MEMVLTGVVINAQEAEKAGLVARVVPDDKVRLPIRLFGEIRLNI